jgi:HD-GYP domain-containing protein (c-di-GMP phosphodiesterase class II)
MADSSELTYDPGEVIARRGEGLDALYRLTSGTVQVRSSALGTGDVRAAADRSIAIVSGPGVLLGDGCGALELRGTTLVAETSVVLERIPVGAGGLARLVLDSPDVGLELAESLTRRVCEIAHGLRFVDSFVVSLQRVIDEHAAAFRKLVDGIAVRCGAIGGIVVRARQTPVYRLGRTAERRRAVQYEVIARVASERPEAVSELRPGELLIADGDASAEMYVLLSGRLEVRAGERTVDEILPGDTVGEVGALLGDAGRSAVGVRATAASRILRIPFDAFRQIMTERPALILHIVEALTRRLDRSYGVLSDLDGTMAGLLDALDGTADSVAFAYEALGRELAEWRAELPEAFGELGGRLASARTEAANVRNGMTDGRRQTREGMSFLEIRGRHELARAEAALARVFARLASRSTAQGAGDGADDVGEAEGAVVTYVRLGTRYHHLVPRKTDLVAHSVRVCVWSALVARRMDLGDAETREVLLAALLHDIGMTCARQPGFRMDRHPTEYASPLLAAVRGVSAGVFQAICQHHEFADGSGYPRGLSGERLSRSGRILSAANHVDLLISKGLAPAEAAQHMRDEASRYDPAALSAILSEIGGMPR